MDFFFYRCNSCRQKQNIEDGSIFQGTQQPLLKYYRAIFISFIQNLSIKKAMKFSDMKEFSMKGVYRYLKKQVSLQIQNEIEDTLICIIPDDILEGEMEAEIEIPSCEIYESLFTHLKTIEDMVESQVLVVGIIDVLQIEQYQQLQVMRRIITAYVSTHPRYTTKIYTDGVQCYNFIENEGYQHIVVTHENGFGSGENTTNHVESLWSEFKSIGRLDKRFNFDTLEQVQG